MIAAVAAGTAILGLYSAINTTNTLYFSDEVSDKSITHLLEQIDETHEVVIPFERNRLVLHSPGGSALSLSLYLNEYKTNKSISLDTYIPVSASSAAALMFLTGKERKMHKDAEVMFHEVRFMIGSLVITLTDLVSIKTKGRFPDNTSDRNKKIIKELERSDNKLNELIHTIQTNIGDDDLHEIMLIHSRMVSFMARSLDKSVGFVLENLMIPNKDVKLGAKQALALGVATSIEGN